MTQQFKLVNVSYLLNMTPKLRNTEGSKYEMVFLKD